uniref:Uncharacterized protein n=1 Tax=Anguilla anguilla TaxID=7936 RepID=A0A0E9QZD6_ANGAN
MIFLIFFFLAVQMGFEVFTSWIWWYGTVSVVLP